MFKTAQVYGLAFVASLTTPTLANNYQSHSSIHEAARAYMLSYVETKYEQTPEIVSGRLDSRLKLRLCSQPLDAYLPDGSRGIGKITLGVKCADLKPWSLHVPIKVSLFKEVLVAIEPLPRGKLLESSDLKLSKVDLSKLPYGFITDLKDSVGMKLKRSIATGVALTPKMVEKPNLILRGQRITILAKSGGIAVRTNGKALANGAAGERIGVINIKSKQKMEGIVTRAGEVRVTI